MNQAEREAFQRRVQEGKSPVKSIRHWQTMRLSFEQICQGEDPWIPLGNFMNDWYAYHLQERERLVCDPLPDDYPPSFHCWAAFCAASVRWFCSTYEIPCPGWVDAPSYILAEPWYMENSPAQWQGLRETTAEEFTHHNIYCGNTVYLNKYERNEQGRWLQAYPVDVQERRALARAATARLMQKRTEAEQIKQKALPLRRALLVSPDIS